MRSRVFPTALCLLLTFLFSSSPAFSTMKTASAKPKSTDNKAVKAFDTSTLFFTNDVLNTQEKVVENPVNVVNLRPQLIDAVAVLNDSNEVFSYNNAVLNGVGNATGVHEKQTNFADSQSLFRNGMFYGFSLMVVLLNLVCFFLFEEKVFLFYSLALTTVTASFIYSDSLFEIMDLSSIENIEAMQSTLLLIATACTALFASKYLSLSEFTPKLKWFSMGLLAFAFMMVFSGWISETHLFTSIANTVLITVMTLYFATGVALFSKKNYAKFYVIAFSIPLLFALDFFVLKKFGIDFLFTESFHLKAATLVEMLIITYAIMYRMRAIKEEHLLRQTEMRIFLKRQEVMNRTNTEKLMQDMYLENLIMQYDLDGLEIKLLQYISEGKDNIKIARKLKTTEIEIEMLTKELYDKLDIGEQIQEDIRMVETQPDYIYN